MYASGSLARSARRVLEAEAGGDVAVERVVGAGLVGDDVDRQRGLEQRRQGLGRVGADRHRERASLLARDIAAPDRGVERLGDLVDVAGVEAPLDARGIDVDAERDAAAHGHRERLGAAHAAEPRGHHEAAAAGCRRTASAPPPRRSRTSPAGCPGCRCRSTTPRSSARTSSAPCSRAARTPPTSPSAAPAASWRSAPAAPARGCGRRRPACPTAPAASRRRAASGASRRWRRSTPRSAPRGRCRRTRPASPGPRRPPGRGCSSGSAAAPPSASCRS